MESYKPIALGTVIDGSEEWKAWRQHGPHYQEPTHPDYIPVTIGGSDVAVIFGDSPWKSSMELFFEKSNLKKPKYERAMSTALLNAGHELEEFVANMFLRAMEKEGVKNIKMWNDTNMYQHPQYKFALANLDRRISVNGHEGILECKTTSNFEDQKLWKAGIVPKKYEWQCRYYMAIMNVSFVYITCCWGFTLDETAVIRIDRDMEIERVMMDTIAQFVENCEMGIEPEVQEKNLKTLANFYVRLYGEISDKEPAVELPDTEEVAELIERASTLFERKERLEKQMDILAEEEYEITSKILKMTGGKTTYATYRMNDDEVVGLKIKLPMKRATFNEEALKQENPAAYAKYCESSFNATAYKKDNKKEAEKYVIPAIVDVTKPASIKEVKVRNIPITKAV